MIALGRHKQILELLERSGVVRTIDLAERLKVTDETIRRDLKKLEDDGLLRRAHGGATSVGIADLRERSFDERNVENLDAKRAIAQAALALIQPNESIFVDASSTALQLVLMLGETPLQVITHSLHVADCLRNRPNVDLIMTGGRLDRPSRSFLGPEALLALRRYRVDKAFCSGNGVEPGLGASEINQDQAILKEVVCARSHHFISLADQSKLGKPSSYYFAGTAEIDSVITDGQAEHPVLKELEAAGVEVISTQLR